MRADAETTVTVEAQGLDRTDAGCHSGCRAAYYEVFSILLTVLRAFQAQTRVIMKFADITSTFE